MKRTHPCRGLCTPSEKQCRGCGRTEEEIRDWNTYSDEKKRQIMDDLPRRLDPASGPRGG